MPDVDGFCGPFADGRSYCAGCDRWFQRGGEREHRSCARRWRAERARRRGRSPEEQLVQLSLSSQTEEE